MYIEIKRKISISVLQIFSKEHSANIPQTFRPAPGPRSGTFNVHIMVFTRAFS
uniref:Uncharacterized protein n=1 Tax=viral metagenome TaxID=1070528 RepID=A0A6C0ESR9_9ZZZZ